MKKSSLAIFLLLVLVSCTSFAYKYYGIEFPESGLVDDVLLFVPKGSKAPKDIPFSSCKPDEQSNGKCVVSLQEEYFNLIRDNETCHVQLAELQRTCKH